MRRRAKSHLRSRHRATLVALASLAIALAGCSRHTSLTVHADLVPFMSPSERQTTVSYPLGLVDIMLPSNATTPNPGDLIDLGQVGVPASVASAVDAFGLDLAATVTPTTDVSPGTAFIYLAPSSASNAFQTGYLVGQVDAPAMTANQTSTVTATLQLDDQKSPDALGYVRSGSFRLGVEVKASASAAGSADAELTRMVVSVSLPPGWGLP